MRTPRSLSTTVAAWAVTAMSLAVALTGCTATIVDRGESDGAPSSSTAEQDDPSTHAPAEDDAAADSADAAGDDAEIASGGLSPENAADRERLTAEATTTMPCPTGTLDQDGAVIRVEGSCTDLVIAIDAGVVIADDVTNLTLSGSGTAVYAESISSLTVTGSASVVYWTGATPSVDDRGTANVLSRG